MPKSQATKKQIRAMHEALEFARKQFQAHRDEPFIRSEFQEDYDRIIAEARAVGDWLLSR